MKIAGSVLQTSELSVVVNSDENINSDSNYLIDQSFSTSYVSAGTSSTFEFEISFTRQNIGYIAVAGHNLGTIGATITVSNGAFVQESYVFNLSSKNQVLVFDIPVAQRNVEKVKISISKNTSDQVKIASITIGEMFEVPNCGEQAGFGYPFFSNHYEIRAQMSSRGAPLESLIKTTSPVINLRVKNVKKDWVKTVWMTLVQNITDGFLAVVHDSVDEAYLLYNAKIDPARASAMSRDLLDVSLKGSAYHGE